MNGSKNTLAGRLLLLGVMSLCAPACLLPQDGSVLPIVDGTNPPKKDHPPLIQIHVPNSQVLSLNMSCPQDFSVTVSDEDEGDRIRSLWFIDHNASFTTTSSSPAPFPGTQQTVVGAGATIDQPVGIDAIYSPQNGTEHTLTVVVSDGEFVSAGQPSGMFSDGIEVAPHSTFFLPDGGTCDGGPCSDPSGTAQYTWVINVITGLCK